MFPHSVPEVVIVDDGHDGNAWDHLPSELPEVTGDFGSAAQPDLAAESSAVTHEEDHHDSTASDLATSESASKKKRRRSRRKKGSTAVPTAAPAVIAAPATTSIPVVNVAAVANDAIQATIAVRAGCPGCSRGVAAPGRSGACADRGAADGDFADAVGSGSTDAERRCGSRDGHTAGVIARARGARVDASERFRRAAAPGFAGVSQRVGIDPTGDRMRSRSPASTRRARSRRSRVTPVQHLRSRPRVSRSRRRRRRQRLPRCLRRCRQRRHV